ncbi:hypothetical protein ABT112_05030 [Streptomyces sp. NPDC002055]|uniref:hypothetical protein n=1 Tax=Streptomyces sp. NPDC002055 TaxID=3154534 RepID=UPI0033192CDA
MVLPLIGAIAFWAVQGLWGWAWEKFSGPPGLTAYAPAARPCDTVTLPLTLQAKTDQAIVVTGVEVDVLPGPPLPEEGAGDSPGQCSDTAHKPIFNADLTKDPAILVPAAQKAEPDSTDFPFTVSADEPKQLNLRLHPGNVRFSLKVEWVADGEYGSVTLDSDGRNGSDTGLS